MFVPNRRVQRRELQDYPSLLVLMDSLSVIDAATRREFAYVNGDVWKRFNAASKGATRRRIVVLFLSNEQNLFEELLFVGCDFIKQRRHDCQALWTGHPLCADLCDTALRRVCIDTPGRAVLMLKELASAPPSVPMPMPVPIALTPSYAALPA